MTPLIDSPISRKALILVVLSTSIFACSSTPQRMADEASQRTLHESLSKRIARMGNSLDETQKRVDVALSATNWRLMRQPQCLDYLYNNFSTLDINFAHSAEVHRRMKEALHNFVHTSKDEQSNLSATLDLEEKSLSDLQIRSVNLVEQAMNPSFKCPMPQELENASASL